MFEREDEAGRDEAGRDETGRDDDGERLDRVIEDVDRFISAASKSTRFGLRVALLFIRLAPILLFLKLTTIERLAKSDRITVLARLEREDRLVLSMAFIGWRTVLTLIFYEDDRELHAIGYRAARTRWQAQPVPTPLESGVRVLGDADDGAAASNADEQEVA